MFLACCAQLYGKVLCISLADTIFSLQHTNFAEAGVGAPVILVHGLAASLVDWQEALPALAQAGFSAFAPDLLGHGESTKPPTADSYTIEHLFACFAGWLDSLALKEPAVLVGHSLGGYLVMRYALCWPEQAAALVLVDPFYSPRQLAWGLRLLYRSPLTRFSILSRAPAWLVRWMVDLASLSIRNGYVLPEEVRAQTALDYRRSHPAIFNIPASMRDLGLEAGKITCPALVVWGKRDATLAPASFTQLAQTLGARQAVLDAGHVPHQSNAVEFNCLLVEFIRSLRVSETAQ
jgi:pimeloyl-ACP methyl ester carboxylesterase